MFKVLRAVVNNMNKSKYLSCRSRIEYKNSLEDKANDKSSSSVIERKIAEIDRLQTEIRSKNLRLFSKATIVARTKQFAAYTVPVVLLGGTIFSFTLPNQVVKTKSLEAFRVTETVFNQEYCLEDISDGSIYYNSFYDKNFVKPTDKNLSDNNFYGDDVDVMIYRIRNELDGILAKIIIYEDGQLFVNHVSSGKYLDRGEYDFGEAEVIDDEYAKFLDEIVDMIYEDGGISKHDKELLMALSESENKDVLVRIIEHEVLGPMDVDIYSGANVWLKGGLALVTIIYIVFVVWIALQGDIKFKELFSRRDGELVLSGDNEETLIFIVRKYKQEFLIAEQDRIKRIYELYSQIVSDASYSPEQLLTGYEKKLLL